MANVLDELCLDGLAPVSSTLHHRLDSSTPFDRRAMEDRLLLLLWLSTKCVGLVISRVAIR